MTLTRWTPFGTFTSVERELQDVMDRFVGRPGALTNFRTEGTWRPAVDIYREGGELQVRCELPGIDPQQDLDITVEGNILRIKGQKSFGRQINDENLYLSERLFGSFERHVHLPEGIDSEQLEANYEAGVLTVSIPMPEESLPKARKLDVKVSS
ncbi:MAG: Hsp20/alpha crystallin family protein [Actinomycetota bacterium]|nr:Hsp20/alpha crystallin family protein [Actinomycetota bacterium]